MSTNMRRVAELEAQVAALTGENEELKRQVEEADREPSAVEIAAAVNARLARIEEQIGAQLINIEENLRRDFTDKFAGNFFRATEAMTSRVVGLEGKQSEIEVREAALEQKFVEYVNLVGATFDKMQKTQAAAFDKVQRAQTATLSKFDESLTSHQSEHAATLTEMQQAASVCARATKQVGEATKLCAGFKADYEEAARGAKQGITVLAQQQQQQVNSLATQAADGLRHHIGRLGAQAEEAMNPVMRRARQFTESQLKWRLYAGMIGFMLCLAVAGGTAYKLEEWLSGGVLRDAGNWRTYFSDLSPEQLKHATRFIEEMDLLEEGKPLPTPTPPPDAAAQSAPAQSAAGQQSEGKPPKRGR